MTIFTRTAVGCLLAASTLLAQTPPASPAASSAESLDQAFVSPPRDAKPLVFWMWLGTAMPHEALTRDLEEMKAKGIVGAIVYPSTAGRIWRPESKMVWAGKGFEKVATDDYKGAKSEGIPGDKLPVWSERWRQAIRHAAKESARLDLDLCVAVGTTAPRTVITPADGQKSLKWTQTAFKGPGRVDATLPVPKLGLSAAAEANLVGEPWVQDVAILAVPQKSVVGVDEVVDLTSKADTDGRVTWDAPPGDWKIFRFSQVATRKGNSHSLFIDGLSGEAMTKAWDGTMKVLLAEMTPEERRGLKFIEEDSWEAGEPEWTQTLATEFKTRRGYDLIPYLPVLAGQVIKDKAASERIEQDYELTISDLYADNHYGRRRELANAVGLPFWSEAAGPNMKQSDLLRNISRVDVGMAEFWMPSAHRPLPDRQFLLREAASANHVYGRTVTPCEAFTTVGPHWEESLFDMKSSADQAFCDGMNRIIFHNFAQSASLTAKPGYAMWAGVHYEPGVTWWDQTPAFNDYLSRVSHVLQQGLFRADALMYRGDPFGYAGHAMKTVLPTLGEGYDSDDCNTEVLLTRVAVKDGRIVLPDGMNYRVLVLPDNQPMRLEALQKVAALVKQGATVVGPRPTAMSGFSPQSNDLAAFDALTKDLWKDSAQGETKIGDGRLVWGKTAREVMQAAGVGPDFEHAGVSDAGTIDWIHRTAGDTDIYYVTSRWPTAEKIEATFRVSGRQPELWDPVTGRTRDATAFRQKDGRTTVPLEFDPCGSTFVVFRKPIAADADGTTATNYPAVTPATAIAGPWDVAFDPKWGGPAKIQFDKLVDWTKRPEDGIKHYSGTAVYRTTFDLPAVPSAGQKMLLDLGKVHEVATVRLNGQDLGVVWTRPSRVDVTSALKAGENELEVSIINLWPNRLIGDASLPKDKRLTVTNMRKFMPQTPLFPSGLLGPVQLMTTQDVQP